MPAIADKIASARASAPKPALPAPRRVVLQRVANVVHINLTGTPKRLVVDPDLAHLFYTHDRTLGDEMRPHRLVWIARFKRFPGETLTIRLCSVTHPAKATLSVLAVKAPAPPKVGAPPPNTWVIHHDENAVETQAFVRMTDDFDRINVKYEVIFASPVRTIPPLDPDINLIPDP